MPCTVMIQPWALPPPSHPTHIWIYIICMLILRTSFELGTDFGYCPKEIWFPSSWLFLSLCCFPFTVAQWKKDQDFWRMWMFFLRGGPTRFALFHGCRVFVSYVPSHLRTPSVNNTFILSTLSFKHQWQLVVIHSLTFRSFTLHEDSVATEV